MKRNSMMRTLAISVLSLVMAALAGGAAPRDSRLSAMVFAQDANDGRDQNGQDGAQKNGFDFGRTRSCSTGILRGRYALSLTGTIVGLGPAAEIGNITFDGAGNLTGTLRASFNGQILPRTATGTYVVNGDCTGSISAVINPGGPIELNLVMVGSGGDKAVVVVTTPGLVFSGTLETQ